MKFLVPVTTPLPKEFGVMAMPTTHRNYDGIKNGLVWGADCGAYNGKLNIEKYLEGLEALKKYKNTCLFVTVPDVIGDAKETIKLYNETVNLFKGFPVAFVAQDGQENHKIPPCDCVFLGGTTAWKMSSHAIKIIKQAYGKHIHIGRVKYRKRYRNFSGIGGKESESWTCDGTRQRFEGIDTAIEGWKEIMEEPLAPFLPLFDSNSFS